MKQREAGSQHTMVTPSSYRKPKTMGKLVTETTQIFRSGLRASVEYNVPRLEEK